jgi:hypothetical protein
LQQNVISMQSQLLKSMFGLFYAARVMNAKEIYEYVKFYIIKLPFIYLLILLGFILEFIVQLPSLVLYTIDTYRGKRSR